MADQPKPTMRLMNVIVIYDVYCVAEQEGPAIDAVRSLVLSGEIKPNHYKALALGTSPVRPDWRAERPIVADDISDVDFERLKGKTTQEVYDLLMRHI